MAGPIGGKVVHCGGLKEGAFLPVHTEPNISWSAKLEVKGMEGRHSIRAKKGGESLSPAFRAPCTLTLALSSPAPTATLMAPQIQSSFTAHPSLRAITRVLTRVNNVLKF